MKIKGEYRDVLSRDGAVILDTGWQSNVIVADYGRFMAALMKKDFERQVGIDYMAVGSGSDNDSAVFKDNVVEFFNENKSCPLEVGEKGKEDYYWVWAKEIKVDDIKYVNDDDDEVVKGVVTNRLKIEVTFRKEEEREEPEPSEDTLEFKEFALLGIDRNIDGTFKKNIDGTFKLFFINYVGHGPITKDKSMVLTRTIILTFPIGKAVVS
jgi:hypothetical protein